MWKRKSDVSLQVWTHDFPHSLKVHFISILTEECFFLEVYLFPFRRWRFIMELLCYFFQSNSTRFLTIYFSFISRIIFFCHLPISAHLCLLSNSRLHTACLRSHVTHGQVSLLVLIYQKWNMGIVITCFALIAQLWWKCCCSPAIFYFYFLKNYFNGLLGCGLVDNGPGSRPGTRHSGVPQIALAGPRDWRGGGWKLIVGVTARLSGLHAV